MAALRRGSACSAVKPLVLERAQAREIEDAARKRGLLVGVEYHKRFDDRSLMARDAYREGAVRRISPRHRHVCLKNGTTAIPIFRTG